MLGTQILLVLMVIGTAFLAPVCWGIQAIAVLFFIGSFIAATHDIAIDGFYLEALDDAEDLLADIVPSTGELDETMPRGMDDMEEEEEMMDAA